MNKYKISLAIFSDNKTEALDFFHLMEKTVAQLDIGIIKNSDLYSLNKNVVDPTISEFLNTNCTMLIMLTSQDNFFSKNLIQFVEEKKDKILVCLKCDQDLEKNFTHALSQLKNSSGTYSLGCDSFCH
jgi:rRNA pseudouridine-1189 N-methylase Emg1 (Nep1/Mra1 family)